MRRSWFVYACAVLSFLILLLEARSAQATWSVVLADSATGEVAIGSVTCLGGDLLAKTPVIVAGKGGGAVQALSDPDGSRRLIIRDELLKETLPEQILEILKKSPGNNRRQYGIVDTKEGRVTFTGKGAGDWAGGVAGIVEGSSTVYAIQGNVLAGSCVVPAMKDALDDNVNADIPEKLMAAMEAAQQFGGDGRCSCGANRTSCGCPPPGFTKSGQIGYMLVARIGDIDDLICNADGCADGDYFMKLNVATIEASDPDPVLTLRQMFNAWRVTLVGHPDAVQSDVSIASAGTTPAGDDVFEMTIQLSDWNNDNITVGVTVTVEHETDSDGISSIGTLIGNGNGEFSVPLTIPAGSTGTDRFKVTVDDGPPRQVILVPSPVLSIGGADADGDGFAAPPVGSDCDDSNPLVNPGATEDCTDGVDNDCDGFVDGADPDCVTDNDGDGFAAPPAGSDCDDTDPSVNPGASEDCADGIDNDCDGFVDGADPDCPAGPGCMQKNEACSLNSECCSGKCRKGKCVGGSASASSTLIASNKTDLTQLAGGNFCPLFPSFYSASFPKGTRRPMTKDAITVDGGIALPSARE